MDGKVGESGKNEFTRKEEGADCGNECEGVLAHLLDFVRHRGIQQPAIARFLHGDLNSINCDYIPDHMYGL